MSATSRLTASCRGSRTADGPRSAKLLRGGPPGDWLLGVADKLAKLFKKFCPFRRARDEYVALVGFVALSAQIAERTEPVQGARHNRLGNVQHTSEPAHRMRPRIEIYHQQQ